MISFKQWLSCWEIKLFQKFHLRNRGSTFFDNIHTSPIRSARARAFWLPIQCPRKVYRTPHPTRASADQNSTLDLMSRLVTFSSPSLSSSACCQPPQTLPPATTAERHNHNRRDCCIEHLQQFRVVRLVGSSKRTGCNVWAPGWRT